MAKTETQITIRVTNEFKARLEAQAERERRSVAGMVRIVLEDCGRRKANNRKVCRSSAIIHPRKGIIMPKTAAPQRILPSVLFGAPAACLMGGRRFLPACHLCSLKKIV